jgi:predicted transglutaminase-like cysteine proteinase
MELRKIVAIAALFGALALPAGTASASSAPLGYQLMCLKYPAQCKGGGAAKVAATDDIMVTLRKVNSRVNGAIRPRADRAGADVWTASTPTAGDCEDYALAKRRALISAGLPASSLRLAYVKTRRGDDHAVLIVKTSKGSLVLDNLTSKILPLSQSGLRVVSMAGANPLEWS